MGIREFFKRDDVQYSFDFDVFNDVFDRGYAKRLALDTCATFVGRSIGQTEFKVKENGRYVKNELYRRLNLRPNINQTASSFWQQVVFKLIYDNEVLIVVDDTSDFLIADSFTHNKYAVVQDNFTDVYVRGYTFRRTFQQSEVLHIKFGNERLSKLLDDLYCDHAELMQSLIGAQKRKNQVRGTVDIDMLNAKTEAGRKNIQDYLDNLFKSFSTKGVAIVPQEKGVEYKEHYAGSGSGVLSVQEIDLANNAYFKQVAMALGIPLPLLTGEISNVTELLRSYMIFTIKPILKKIVDEINSKFITSIEYLEGNTVSANLTTHIDLFDLANNIDKLRGTGIFTGNDLREKLGEDRLDIPELDQIYITKNYADITEELKGGE